MGIRNYLIGGVSGAGKTTVCNELQRRGCQAIHGDRELAYQGDPETGIPTAGFKPEHHIWHIDKVKNFAANQDESVTFFCGGTRNFPKFIDLFDGVFVLEVDLETSLRRIDERVALGPTDWGGRPEEREISTRLYGTKEGIPKNGFIIDATKPIDHVVDEIIRQTEENKHLRQK
ncbi:AAA family ATPase [Peribacillus sp. SCS-26]|uniref:AAA family ATPase n=1 Tax=Paraperibacillus marinus TaxID=3115295 RepID=UPI003905B78A